MANFGFLVPTGGGEDIPLKKDRILGSSKDIGLSRIWIVETGPK